MFDNLKTLEAEVVDLKSKLQDLKNMNSNRELKLNLLKAVAKLSLRGTSKGFFWRPIYQYTLENIVCYGQEEKCWYDYWVRLDGILVYQANVHDGTLLFKDGEWADKISEHWRHIFALEEIEELKVQISKFEPLII